MSEWPPERVERLKILWAEGWTASQIARELGAVSRSAICGKINRLGMSGTRQRAEATQALGNIGQRVARRARAKPSKPQQRPNPRALAKNIAARRNDPGESALPTSPIMDASKAKPWTERAFGECAYPISGSGADTSSCCQPATERGYCAGHWALMTRPMTPAERRRFQRLPRLAA